MEKGYMPAVVEWLIFWGPPPRRYCVLSKTNYALSALAVASSGNKLCFGLFNTKSEPFE